MKDESDRLSKYGSLDAYGSELLHAARAEQGRPLRALFRRKLVLGLIAIAVVGVPAGLAGAGVIGESEPECRPVTPDDMAVVEDEIARGGSTPILKDVTPPASEETEDNCAP